MKKLYENLSRALIILLVTTIPLVSSAQTATTKDVKPATKEQTKKDTVKKVRDVAPTNTYWSVTAYGALNQFNGDLSKNLIFNSPWKFGAGFYVTRQFGRVIGARFNLDLGTSLKQRYWKICSPGGHY